MNLEDEFTEAMQGMYQQAGEETGYWGRRFLQSIKKKGGLATAQKMLQKQNKSIPTQGLQALIKVKRLDLSLETLVLQSKFEPLFSKSELGEARRRLSPFPESYFSGGKSINISQSTWILQGNPKRYNIDDYLSRYAYIYWSVSRYQSDFNIGDVVYIWRSGEESGVVAYGIVEELPTPILQVQFPDALGEDLWEDTAGDTTDIKVGIRLEQTRLNDSEGMIERDVVKRNPILNKNPIITQPNNTVFKLDEIQSRELSRLWSGENENSAQPFTSEYSISEGSMELRYHYQRERSAILVKKKKEEFKSFHGKVQCEICGFCFEEIYPHDLGKDYIEAHHKTPLSKISGKIKTTLDDLMLVCSNCHRMIHRTKECEENLNALINHFKEEKNNS